MSLRVPTKTMRLSSACLNIRFPNSLRIHHAHARWQSNTTFEANNRTVAFPSPTQLKTQESHVLARLPLSSIIRSLVLGVIFSSPSLSTRGLAILSRIAHSHSIFLNPDKNPLIRFAVKPLVYNHFCAGTNEAEIRHTAAQFKNMGYSGVVLCYGKEHDEAPLEPSSAVMDTANAGVQHWEQGNLKTLEMLQDDDVLAMKYTGAGKSVTDALALGADPPKPFAAAMETIIQRAIAQKTRIFVDAEKDKFQLTIDRWTIDFMRRHNRNGNIIIYNTIQAYLKNSRQKLETQLQLAQTEGWTFAFKLVRGAYIDEDPRHIIHDTQAQTDACYNSIVHDVLTGNISTTNAFASPQTALFLAGHNAESVAKASALIRTLSVKGALKTVPEFGQLQGMADQLGCRIIQDGNNQQDTDASPAPPLAPPRVYKVAPWGSVQECMQYLVRRAVENRGATHRMSAGMTALSSELGRRAINQVLGRR